MRKRWIGILIIVVFAYIVALYILYQVEARQQGSNIDSFFNALWFSLVSFTSVGYGDYFPVTWAGKSLSLFFVLGSLAITGFLIGRLNYVIIKYMEAKRYGQFGKDITNHTIVFGLNKLSVLVVGELIDSGVNTMVVSDNKNELDSLLNRFKNKSNLFVFHCEYDNYESLSKVNIASARCVYVSFLDDSESLVHILNLKNKYETLDIIVNLNKPMLKDTFKQAGVLFIISQEEIASRLLASYIFEPNVARITEDLMSGNEKDGVLDMQEYIVNSHFPYIGSAYNIVFDVLKRDLNSILIGIYKNATAELIMNPRHDVTIEINDKLVILQDSINDAEIKKVFQVG